MSETLMELYKITDKITILLESYTKTLKIINHEGGEHLTDIQSKYLKNLINQKVAQYNRNKLLNKLNGLTKIEASQLKYKINHGEYK